MDIVQVFLIAICVSIDALTVAISLGIATFSIKIKSALKIALYFGTFQFFMPIMGSFLSKIYEKQMIILGNLISFLVLSIIGFKMLIDTYKNEDKDCNIIEKGLFCLALATSIDAMAVGLSLSLINIPIVLSSCIIGIVAFLLSFFGAYVGKKLGDNFSKKASRIGAYLLISIGIKFFVQYLLE